MTQEEKQLLLVDLCARLPYGVIVERLYIPENNGFSCEMSCQVIELLKDDNWSIKPYLRPMSSMTEEEEKELKKIHHQFDNGNFIDAGVFSTEDCGCTVFEMSDILRYLKSRHFDYRGLIEKGIALEAPEGMYKIE